MRKFHRILSGTAAAAVALGSMSAYVAFAEDTDVTVDAEAGIVAQAETAPMPVVGYGGLSVTYDATNKVCGAMITENFMKTLSYSPESVNGRSVGYWAGYQIADLVGNENVTVMRRFGGANELTPAVFDELTSDTDSKNVTSLMTADGQAWCNLKYSNLKWAKETKKTKYLVFVDKITDKTTGDLIEYAYMAVDVTTIDLGKFYYPNLTGPEGNHTSCTFGEDDHACPMCGRELITYEFNGFAADAIGVGKACPTVTVPADAKYTATTTWKLGNTVKTTFDANGRYSVWLEFRPTSGKYTLGTNSGNAGDGWIPLSGGVNDPYVLGLTKGDFEITGIEEVTTEAPNGTVSVTPGKAGDEVTVTVTPDEGYEVDTITVKDKDGKEVEVADGKFTMPAGGVTVIATFKKLPVTLTPATPVDPVTSSNTSTTTSDTTSSAAATVAPVEETVDAEVKLGETATVKSEALDGDITVAVDKEDTALEGAKLEVEATNKEETTSKLIEAVVGKDVSAEVKEVVEAAVKAVKDGDAFTLDISFKKDGKNVQPGKDVTVTAPVPASLKGADKLYVYHVTDKGLEDVTAKCKYDKDKGTIALTNNVFSPYIISKVELKAQKPATSEAANTSTTTPGTNNPYTGAALAIAPVVLAGAAVVAFTLKKRH